jgi:fumarate reductase subunit C
MSQRKPYVRQMPKNWWLKNLFFTKYMIRESSSVVISLYSFVLLFGLLRLTQGSEAFHGWLASMSNPWAIGFHAVALAWALYHSFTWFSLAPKAANVWIGNKRISDALIVRSMYGALLLVSLIVLAVIIF